MAKTMLEVVQNLIKVANECERCGGQLEEDRKKICWNCHKELIEE
jgi:predicted amidophosphoribosyltransferase